MANDVTETEYTPHGQVLVLNDHGERAATVGDLRDVWSLGSYDAGVSYWIELDTLNNAGTFARRRGRVRLPVGSIGKIDGRFYFATDMRFVVYPGATCVMPSENRIELTTWEVGGGWRGSFYLCGVVLFSVTTRINRDDVLADLVMWAVGQTAGRFVFPPEIVGLMDLASAAVKLRGASQSAYGGDAGPSGDETATDGGG